MKAHMKAHLVFMDVEKTELLKLCTLPEGPLGLPS